jgi:histidyl-tRNA synthetase
MEQISRSEEGEQLAQARLEALYPTNGPGMSEMSSNSAGAIAGGDAQRLASLLSGISVAFGSDDARQEVVERYLWKIERSEQRRRILDALEFLRALHAISGSPPEVFASLREVLERYEMDPQPLAELEQLVAVIEQSGVTNQQILLNLALGRGVSYYTGLVFEIHALDEDGSDTQLCGGGRYDQLLRTVGGTRDVNACGFAFGVERLLPLVPQSDLPKIARTQALVIPVSLQNLPYTLQVARTARIAGLRVEVDVTGHGIGAGLKLATKKQVRLALIVGDDEQQKNRVLLHDLVTGEELVLDIDSLAQNISGEELPL